jgi:4-amino-4-deoxy-L-arabinose transferase-like glycosyltransferase
VTQPLALAALAALTLLRLAAAWFLPLAPDEAYYWVWGRALAPGYLDHPPMVALWTAAGTALAGDTPLGIRLLGPIGVAIASLALAGAGAALFPAGRRAGIWAAALFNATLLVGAGAVLMTPDTPQLVFWCLSLWALARLRATGQGGWWLAVGVFAGATLLSKYTGLLLGVGILLWLLLDPAMRVWFRRWQLWAAGALALAVFAPVIAWNAAHGWASFAKQGGRAGAGGGDALRFLGELVGGQLGLATPIIFALCVIGTAAALRRCRPRRVTTGSTPPEMVPLGAPVPLPRRMVTTALPAESAALLLAALVVPGTLLFLWQATGSRVQGNWPAILYPAACLAAAGFLTSPRARRWQAAGIALGAALTLAVFLQAGFAPLRLPRGSDPGLARLGGWPGLAAALEAERRATGAAFVAAEEYGLASQLALLLPPGVPVVALGDRWDLFTLPDPPPGATGLLLRSRRRADPPLWPGAVPAGELVRARQGIEAERYGLYRVATPAGGQPAALLPRPR